MFDIQDWVEDKLRRVQKSSGTNFTAECPSCGRWGKFYVDVESGKWVCFSGKCGVRGGKVWSLIALVDGINPAQARAQAVRSGIKFARRKATPQTLAEKLSALRGEAGGNVEAESVAAELPDEFIAVYDEKRKKQWRPPKYLRARGIQRDIARRFGLGWTKEGVWYPRPDMDRDLYVGGRLFIPVVCPTGYSWSARDMDLGNKPKYLNAPGADHRKLLQGWDQVDLASDVVLVEGPLDVIRSHQNGLPALGMFGKVLNREQLSMMRLKPPVSAVTVMLDEDALADAYKIGRQLLTHFDEVHVAELPSGVDPGNATREQAWAAYDDAPRYRGDRAAGLLARFGGLA